MLQPGLGAAALSKPVIRSVSETQPLKPVAEASPPRPDPPPNVEAEPTDKLVQFSLTKSALVTLDTMIKKYAKTGVTLRRSEMLRAILKAMNHAMPELEREAQYVGTLNRPKNDRGNEALREMMEQSIAYAIIAGMRATDLPIPSDSLEFQPTG
jgi:hypothetical protein